MKERFGLWEKLILGNLLSKDELYVDELYGDELYNDTRTYWSINLFRLTLLLRVLFTYT